MKRLIGLASALLFVVVATSRAHAGDFVAGEHYEVLPTTVETSGDGVEVVEVFSYACIHCFTFEPVLTSWQEAIPEDVDFRRVPAVFSEVWALFAQYYYAAEILGVLEQVHEPIFSATHVERIDLRDPQRAAALFEEEAGVEPEQFLEVLNSFSVRSKVQQALASARAFRVTGVPTLVVAGKYRIDGNMAGSNNRMLEVVDFLVEKERALKLGSQLTEAAGQ